MNVLLLTSHSIAEYDDLRMLTDLGYDVFSIGAYTTPWTPTDDKRPALLNVTYHRRLHALCDRQRETLAELLGDPGPNIDWAKARLHPDIIDWAKARLHPDIIDWADVIIVHHFPERWIGGQWDAIKGKRVIWRTCGQSSPDGSLERFMAQFPVEIVRYSPKERCLPDFAGEDALIRFGKYPSDYGPWTGEVETVLNIAQHERVPHARDWWLNWGFWEEATKGLPTTFAGPHTELIGGLGSLDYPAMLAWLCKARAYLYTGTQPASYTLGLIEAMLTGIPVFSIGPQRMSLPDLFEGHEIAMDASDDPDKARDWLNEWLGDWSFAKMVSPEIRERAIALFGIETIGPQWKAFLG